MFSYLFRNEKDDKDGVDYALLAPIPNFVYDFIAKNGINSFRTPNKFSFEEEFFCSDNSDTQIGYVYQEASVSKILSNLDLTEVNIFFNILLLYVQKLCIIWNIVLQKNYSIKI